jgi:GNAT superfamily N-acetyltransferase
MEVRPFRDSEQEKIKNFIIWILEKEYTTSSEEYPEQDLDNLKKIYQQPGCIMLVAEEEGQLIGTIAVKDENKEVALIRRFFIHPAYRRRGYGSVLVNRAIDFCRLNGYKKVIFRATSNMSAAISLFIKQGFKELERVPFENLEIISLHHSLT